MMCASSGRSSRTSYISRVSPTECQDYPVTLPTIATADASGTGSVTSLAWTSDGCSLAVGWQRGLGIWSISGRQTFFNADDQGSAADAGGEGASHDKQYRGAERFRGEQHLVRPNDVCTLAAPS
jgi:hypothetical protein